MQSCILIRPDGETFTRFGDTPMVFWGIGSDAEADALWVAARKEFGHRGAYLKTIPYRDGLEVLMLKDARGIWQRTEITFPLGEGSLALALKRLLEGTGWRVVETDSHGNEVNDYDLIADETS